MLWKKTLNKLNYDQKAPLQFLNKRLAGLWLVWIGLVIVIGTLLGGEFGIHPVIFIVGYAAGMALIFNSKTVEKRFSQGPASPFQEKITNVSIVLMFVLMTLFAGRYFVTLDFRMIWLGALLATALHFFPFALVHGPAMVVLGILLTATTTVGYLLPELPFYLLGLADGVIKLLFGIALFTLPVTRSGGGNEPLASG